MPANLTCGDVIDTKLQKTAHKGGKQTTHRTVQHQRRVVHNAGKSVEKKSVLESEKILPFSIVT